jgi:hypothetical protein
MVVGIRAGARNASVTPTGPLRIGAFEDGKNPVAGLFLVTVTFTCSASNQPIRKVSEV